MLTLCYILCTPYIYHNLISGICSVGAKYYCMRPWFDHRQIAWKRRFLNHLYEITGNWLSFLMTWWVCLMWRDPDDGLRISIPRMDSIVYIGDVVVQHVRTFDIVLGKGNSELSGYLRIISCWWVYRGVEMALATYIPASLCSRGLCDSVC